MAGDYLGGGKVNGSLKNNSTGSSFLWLMSIFSFLFDYVENSLIKFSIPVLINSKKINQ
ncbi:hypothetical protein [Chryseobacterium sp. NFX27]|uniref:hypothetical protein n=1 Tax=Chryseobacterium sp. NFX27 TaxID=2819618 RepID=UPI003CEE6247